MYQSVDREMVFDEEIFVRTVYDGQEQSKCYTWRQCKETKTGRKGKSG